MLARFPFSVPSLPLLEFLALPLLCPTPTLKLTVFSTPSPSPFFGVTDGEENHPACRPSFPFQLVLTLVPPTQAGFFPGPAPPFSKQ